MKSVADGETIRERILIAFEKAERCETLEESQKFLRFAIVGAGPTGVEMAGSMAEFVHRTLFKNFRHINPGTSEIYLIEGASQILPSFPADLAKKAHENLRDLGVKVVLNTFVTNVNDAGIEMDGKLLETPNIIWAAGNQASPLLKTLDVPLDKQGGVIVGPDLSIPGFPNVFVIGDAAYFVDSKGQRLAGIAPVAIQQGRYVAKVIKKNVEPNRRKPFVYFDKGTIATIGRGKAVAMVGRFRFSGYFAWLIWCFIHIRYLVSFRYRFLIFSQWVFLYLLTEGKIGSLTTQLTNTSERVNRG